MRPGRNITVRWEEVKKLSNQDAMRPLFWTGGSVTSWPSRPIRNSELRIGSGSVRNIWILTFFIKVSKKFKKIINWPPEFRPIIRNYGSAKLICKKIYGSGTLKKPMKEKGGGNRRWNRKWWLTQGSDGLDPSTYEEETGQWEISSPLLLLRSYILLQSSPFFLCRNCCHHVFQQLFVNLN